MTGSDYKEGSSFIVWALVMLFVVVAGFFLINAVFKPAAVLSKVTDPDKIINSYEWFHSAKTEYDAKVRLITSQKNLLENEKDSKERVYLRTELTGMQQNCRELAAKYNAKSQTITVGMYKGTSLPQQLSMNGCE